MDKLTRTLLSIRQLRCRGCKRPLDGCISEICACCGEAYCLRCANAVRAHQDLTKAEDQCLVTGWQALVDFTREVEFLTLERDPDEPVM